MSAQATITTPTSRAYMIYDVNNPPPKPAQGIWTRFVCISDTHESEFAVPWGDVLLHGGDLTEFGHEAACGKVFHWLAALPHKHKIVIAGNHDLTFHDGWYKDNYKNWHQSRENSYVIKSLYSGYRAKQANITYLENTRCEVRVRPGGKIWSVYGSPWQPGNGRWAFNYERGSAQAGDIISKFPKTDILLTHGPPHGVLDRVLSGANVGCEVLAGRIPQLRPRLHVFGHIHEAHGLAVQNWRYGAGAGEDVPHTVFANAAAWPMGRLARAGQRFGEGAFAPVIVDLFDAVHPGRWAPERDAMVL